MHLPASYANCVPPLLAASILLFRTLIMDYPSKHRERDAVALPVFCLLAEAQRATKHAGILFWEPAATKLHAWRLFKQALRPKAVSRRSYEPGLGSGGSG